MHWGARRGRREHAPEQVTTFDQVATARTPRVPPAPCADMQAVLVRLPRSLLLDILEATEIN